MKEWPYLFMVGVGVVLVCTVFALHSPIWIMPIVLAMYFIEVILWAETARRAEQNDDN